MSTIVTLFLMKQREKTDGTYPIYIRSIKNRKASYVSTNHSVLLKDWDDKKCKVKSSYPNSARLNKLLRTLEDDYRDSILEIENNQLDISLKAIKRKLLGSNSVTFTATAKELSQKYKIEGKIGSYSKVNSIISKFTGYMHSEDFTFTDIDVKVLSNYQNYLIENFKNKASTVNRDLKFIKTVYNYAQRMEYIPLTVNPFLNYHFLKSKSERGFLTPEEIKLIEEADCSHLPYVQKAKDVGLFEYYSGGIRISDILLLKWENIHDERIHLTIKKTGAQTSHKLSPKALLILKKYQVNNTEFIFGYLPNQLDINDLFEVDKLISSNTALINKGLKRVAEMSKVNKQISTHLFRHSFATNALQQGMSLDVLQKIFNHSNIRETQIYAKVLNQKVDAEIDKLAL
jgi:integrase/recombinase XerD